MSDINLGDATLPEAIAYFEVKLAKLMKENEAVSKKYILARERVNVLHGLLDELCAHAEPVCDSLEMGQALKSPDTLKNFREHLSRGWEAL